MEEDNRCPGCGVALREGIAYCRKPACQPPSNGKTAAAALLCLVLGGVGAGVGGSFAFAASQAANRGIVLLWMLGALGLVGFVVGAVDLLRVLLAMSRGEAAAPLATKWLIDQIDKAGQ